MVWKRPTVDTTFCIDWTWWQQQGRNYRVDLFDQLCEECRRRFSSAMDVAEVDWVDPKTAEVTRADALLMCLRTRCNQDPQYLNETLPLTSAVFRVFLMNGNEPLSPRQLHEQLPWRQPEVILQVIGGRATHYGIRPA